MKKWLCVIFLSLCIFITPQKKVKAEDWVAIITDIISWGFGDGFMKQCSKWLECDEYEDTSLSDQITGLTSMNKKERICAANSLVKNISRVAGTALATFVGIPPPASYMLANLAGNALQCLQAYIESKSVKTKIGKYELCYSDSSEGHPLPLTDKQIAKILPKVGKFPTVDNIIEQYPKLCIKEVGNDESYKFYNEGDYFDGVYIYHADGYSYLLCASLYEACPCVFNIQGGKINDPEYERDDNDVIKMRADGSLIHEGDSETNRANEDNYKAKYAKHCRLIRFREVYEQSNDLSPIYSDACFDLHGYSKRQANITAGIVQCVEDTARNVFEKPILTVQQQKLQESAYTIYGNDYSFIYGKYNKIKNLLQERNYENVTSGEYPAFLESDIEKILHLLQEIWFSAVSTSILSYECTTNEKYNFTGYQTNIYDKYINSPAENATANCCSSDTNISVTCYGDSYTGDMDDLKPSITKTQETIDLAHMFVEIAKIEVLLNHVQDLKLKASEAESTKIGESTFTLTLFDLLRNKIKVLAVIALVFWMFLFGWKMINGDYGKIKAQEFGMIALRVFLCYMVVFSDSTKNMMFNLAIQTSQGVGMFFNDIMQEFRSQQDNKYSHACNMKQNSRNSPKKTYLETVLADSTVEKKYTCQSWEEKICKNTASGTVCVCEEYKMLCNGDYHNLTCSQYFKDYDGNDNESYCKSGTCSSSEGYVKANIYRTGTSRVADEYPEYTFTCPLDSEEYGCSEYKAYYGKQQCIKKQCRKFSLSCDEGQSLSCRRYEILEDGSKGACISGVCIQERSAFVLMPPMERPYKIKTYYNIVKPSEGAKIYQPYCHKKPAKATDQPEYNSGDPKAEQKYSAALGTKVFVCPDDDRELDDGFRISEYIRHGIIPDDDNSILVLQSLLPESLQRSLSNNEKVVKLKQMPVPTAVATSDKYGSITEYNFIDANRSSEGFQRAKYRTYIRSLLSYVNKNSSYPKIKEYGYTRDYSHLSFWDSMDCKIIQFISMQGFDSGFTEDINGIISGVQNGSDSQLINSALNGLLQFLKFMFMAFPFGILVFILMFGIGAALFMLVARAAQQYCICVFHLVLLVYLSPFVFMLWLFDQTKNVLDSWIGDMKNNILGACVPFITISMFLYIIDWLLFGDVTKYVSMQLFLPSGAINLNCYEDHLSDAPIACLAKRCLDTFTWLGIFGLNQGVSLYSADAFKMLGYLVLRCLFAAGIIMSMTSLLDKMEDAIYNVIGARPDMEVDAGFNQKASAAIQAGQTAGLAAGKFALSTMQTVPAFVAGGAFKILSSSVKGVGVIAGGIVAAGIGIVRLFSPKKADELDKKFDDWNKKVDNAKENASNTGKRIRDAFVNAVTYVPRQIKKGYNNAKNSVNNAYNNAKNSMRRGMQRTFRTKGWQDHQQRLNNIENNYNQAIVRQNEIKEQKINRIRNLAQQQRENHVNVVEEYGNNLAQQRNADGGNRFNADQINAMKEQKMNELRAEVQRLEQEGIQNVQQEFNQKQTELQQIMNNGKNNENENW